jgi:sigma-B regulation protein RsbU (phosphoserine phosphatase)
MDDATEGVPSTPTPEHIVLERQLEVVRRLRAAADVAGRLSPAHGLEALAHLTAEAVVDALAFDAAEVWLAESPDHLRLAAMAGDHGPTGRLVGDVVPVESGPTLVADVARTRLPVLLNDLGEPYPAASLWPVLLDDELQAVLVALSRTPVDIELADVVAAFVTVVAASLNSAGLLAREAETRRRADEERERLAFLAESTTLLSSSLDLPVTMRNVAALALRRLAQWCQVNVLDDDGDIVTLTAGEPVDGEPDVAVEEVTRSGETYATARMLVVPMWARGRTVGAVVLARGKGAPPYTEVDIGLAGAFARRAGMAADNAQLYRKVREGEQRFRSFVDGLGAVLFEADPATLAYTFVSHQAEELLGYPVARWTSEADFWARHVHPDDREWVVPERVSAVSERRVHDVEYRMQAADGRHVWVRDIVYVIADDADSSERLVGIMVDATERKQAEEELRASHERFASLNRTLQASLLPPLLPEIFGLEVAARYRPAGHGLDVVGDFYDLFEVGADGWGVVIGDVCGKGVEAASLTALARYTVRAAAMRERVPSRVLDVLNEAVLAADTGERFCTAVFAVVVPEGDGMTCTLSCGGHPLPLVLRAEGMVESIGRPGTLLGLWPEPDLADDRVSLAAGDALVFYTDGALEARHGREQLGEERLRELVSRCAGLRAPEIADAVAEGVEAFELGVAGDDLAVVVLRVPG